MHLLEYFFPLAFDLDTDIGSKLLQVGCQPVEVLGNIPCIHYHHHVEIPLNDSLRDVQNIYVLLCQICTYSGNDADSVLADHGDYTSVHFYDIYGQAKIGNLNELAFRKEMLSLAKLKKTGKMMGNFLFLGNIGVWEIVLIALVVLLFFGGRKIPELMKGLGKGVKSFKEGMNEVEKELNAPVSETKPSASSSGKQEPEQANPSESEKK